MSHKNLDAPLGCTDSTSCCKQAARQIPLIFDTGIMYLLKFLKYFPGKFQLQFSGMTQCILTVAATIYDFLLKSIVYCDIQSTSKVVSTTSSAGM